MMISKQRETNAMDRLNELLLSILLYCKFNFKNLKRILKLEIAIDCVYTNESIYSYTIYMLPGGGWVTKRETNKRV